MGRKMILIVMFGLFCLIAKAQTTEFTYQGTLKDNGSPTNANYDFEFALFDTSSGGAQIGATIPKNNLLVTNGVFAAKLDFGAVFPGANRYLEIRVRQTGQPSFTTLTPRHLINSAPYSVKSLNADNATNATNATTATNATQLGGVAAGQYVITTDPRMSDSRMPTAGSANYIQNQNSGSQASSNFNVSGNGKASIFDAATQFNINGVRMLSNAGANNLFAGQNAGSANTGGAFNVFAGKDAGAANTAGSENAFVGYGAGQVSQSGDGNSFFGAKAGNGSNLGNNNTFVGRSAGFNTLGVNANENTFVGALSGIFNSTSRGNTLIGFGANTTNPGTLNNATAIGNRAFVTQSNSLVLGSINGVNGCSAATDCADTNVGIGTTAPTEKLDVVGNIKFSGSISGRGTINWQEVLGSVQAESNKGYLANSDSIAVPITLPKAPNFGDVFRVSASGAGGWKIAQNPNQSIVVSAIPSTGLIGEFWTFRFAAIQNINSIGSSADGAKLVVVGTNAPAAVSADYGTTWTFSGSSRHWTSVASSADGSKLVGCVDSGTTIYTSSDSGMTWTARATPFSGCASVASSSDGSKLVVVVNGGQIFTSTNSGVGWATRETARSWISVASSADGTKLVAVENGGRPYTSINSGVNWTPRDNANRNWNSVASSSDGTNLLAAVNTGQLYTSTDSGVTWTARESVRSWTSVASSADGSRLIAAAAFDRLYISTNSGVTWVPREEPSASWNAVASSADGLRLVGSRGDLYTSVLATTDGTAGYLFGTQFASIELQYIGNGKFIVLSYSGTITGN